MNARNGKIARLPHDVREELNERLECSEESPQLLPWLNALPEVKKIVRAKFGGVPVSKQNLSEWRLGGFQEWLLRRDLFEEARDVTHLANQMEDGENFGVLADDVATVLTARFAGLITRWDGEVDAKFEAKARVLNRLCRSVAQLQRGMHRSRREAFEMRCSLENKEKEEKKALKRKLVKPFTDVLRVPSMAKVFGGGVAGEKIAKYILAVQNDNLDAKLDVLPTDEFGEPAKRAKKTKAKNAKPLESNDIESMEEDESSPCQSESVKPGQSDLAQPDEGEPAAAEVASAVATVAMA